VSCYELRLRGALGPATLGAFEEFAVVDRPSETVLRGEVDDREGVSELLGRIQDLGLELLGMRRLPPDQGP
jgi:hypothetical protein